MNDNNLESVALHRSYLLILFDFLEWKDARQWSYVASYLLFHDLQKNLQDKVELLVIPGNYNGEETERIIERYTRDMTWETCLIWVPHLTLSFHSIDLIDRATKQKVFIITESLINSNSEIKDLPHLKHRYHNFTKIADKFSPIIAMCPVTHNRLTYDGFNSHLSLGFWPESIELKEIQPKSKFYSFSATLYNPKRREIVKKINIDLSESDYENVEIHDDSVLTSSFESIFKKIIDNDLNEYEQWRDVRKSLTLELGLIRKKIWVSYVRRLGKSRIVLTMPSYYRGVPGRIIEALFVSSIIIFINSNLINSVKVKLNNYKNIFFLEDWQIGSVNFSKFLHQSNEDFLDVFPYFYDFFMTLKKSDPQVRLRKYLECKLNADTKKNEC